MCFDIPPVMNIEWLSSLQKCVSYVFQTHQREKSAHCHLAPVCNSYRGMYADSTDPSHAAAEKVKEIATRLREDKTPVSLGQGYQWFFASIVKKTVSTVTGNLPG